MPTNSILKQLNNYEIISFNDEVEQTDYEDVVELICQTITKEKPNVILDFSGVSMTSSSIKAIIKTHKILKNATGNLAVLISKPGLRILDKTNLTSIIPCFSNLKSLQDYLKLKKLS